MTTAEGLYDRLDELFEALQGSDVREFELVDASGRVRIHRQAVSAEDAAAGASAHAEFDVVEESAAMEVTSSLVGTFYRAGRPGEPPFVDVGTYVEDGTIVGIVEALQVLTEIEAGCTGTVVEALAIDGQPVEYGQVLFRVMADG